MQFEQPRNDEDLDVHAVAGAQDVHQVGLADTAEGHDDVADGVLADQLSEFGVVAQYGNGQKGSVLPCAAGVDHSHGVQAVLAVFDERPGQVASHVPGPDDERPMTGDPHAPGLVDDGVCDPPQGDDGNEQDDRVQDLPSWRVHSLKQRYQGQLQCGAHDDGSRDVGEVVQEGELQP